ncbi:mannosyltransferase [Piromyces finnis]|uniref:Mannosyltransferase n=1 Tax=Piromyces finnis TaxID=1754191 RepID=A0A1Y1UZ14_9FUNG|nr:mannosyltransferase [Piromyces finnis]|eukprot:ORX43813.1 mannosyltransferase [Piromyces finnis]
MKMKTVLLPLLSLITLSYAYNYSHFTDIDPRFETVTCSSTIKLQNVVSGAKLHSHNVRYGSGSNEQSVTGFNENDDSNSYWMVTGKFGKDCERGKKIKCNSIIRLQHSETKKWLNANTFQSPLSGNGEVNCVDNGNEDTEWKVECLDKKAKYWIREQPVRFIHSKTGNRLCSFMNYVYNDPIRGQMEVCAVSKNNVQSQWKVMEGFFFSEKNKN